MAQASCSARRAPAAASRPAVLRSHPAMACWGALGGRRLRNAPRAAPASAAGDSAPQRPPIALASRRLWMASVPGLLAGLAPLLQAGRAQAAEAPGVEVLSDEAGFGTHPAQKGDLLLLHYTGTIKDTGVVFDSTLGGLAYRDGGMGVLRPAIIRLGGDPVPGVCKGLRLGLEGMRVGGKRSFVVPAELGFRRTVLAPYAVVPEGAALVYEVELIRLSARGPDELTKGIERCGQGGASQQLSGCTQIEPKEFLL